MREITQKDQDRFWAKVHKTETCWLWTGHVDPKGYGNFTVGYDHYRNARFSWIITAGPIPEGLYVCHHCDNPRCVRPLHLFLGTPYDNTQDCARKGRAGAQIHPDTLPRGDRNGSRVHPETLHRGSSNHKARLTETQVVEIHRLLGAGMSRPKVAQRFGVHHNTIKSIATGVNWKHFNPAEWLAGEGTKG